MCDSDGDGVTKKLIENGLVTGVHLDDSSGNTVLCLCQDNSQTSCKGV